MNVKKAQYYKLVLTAVKKYSFGEKNGDKKFLVLRSYDKRWGLYSTVLLLLPFIEKARKRDYIPVIDFTKNNLPLIQDEKKRRRENSWEYYYKQPSAEISLMEVYESKNVWILEEFYVMKKAPDWNNNMPASQYELKRWNQIIRKNIHLSDGLAEVVHAEEKRFLRKSKKFWA